nr:bifunctional diaminohydroxyphosphoribosylaminopyrimidine deaminase/5-amino-6-(5-phosphoribosylamino)uracil reductase RibD [Roseospirillum parvum]
MVAALGLAARGLGRVAPNPAVGCVLVDPAGRVVGRGWTQPGGRPHAETEALARAGERARGATAYVTLEPCSHHGKTPPCADALIAAGVARVVVACADPDPRVCGRGLARLREAGIEVVEGLLAEEAWHLNRGFFLRLQAARPLVTLKLATSLDGRIALHDGTSQWITGPEARADGHRLRATHDAVLVGSGTALADDPALTCRLPGAAEPGPVRVVADGRLRLSRDSRLARTAREGPTWVVTTPAADPAHRAHLEAAGVRLLEVAPDGSGSPAPAALLSALAGAGLTRVLVEGGGRLAAAFLIDDLVDDLMIYRAPRVLGGDARPAVAALGLAGAAGLAAAPGFRLVARRRLGEDEATLLTRPARRPT